jgi:hypothetical protein
MWANGILKPTRERAWEGKSGLMALSMRGSGLKIKPMVAADLSIQMVTSTRVIGSMIKLRVMEYILIWMELDIQDTGRKISKTGKAEKPGLTEQCMKVIT